MPGSVRRAPAGARRHCRRQMLGLLGLAVACAAPIPTDPGRAVRLVEHVGGRAAVPIEPQRVATAYGEAELHAALLLRATPVASSRGPADALLDRYGYRLDEIPRYPFGELDLQMLAAARPEVILHVAPVADEHRRLQTIAPVVLVDRRQPVDEQLRLVGRALGREDDVERAIAGHAYRTARVAEIVAASALARSTVAVVQPVDDDACTLLGSHSPPGAVLREVGVGRVLDAVDTAPADRVDHGAETATGGVDDAVEHGVRIPAERLALLHEAHVILRLTGGPGGPTAFDADPRWRRLPAVAAGRVLAVRHTEFARQSALIRLARLEEIERAARMLPD